MKPDSFRDFVLEQLRAVRPLTCRAMFGGYGISSAGVFFGIVHKGRLYFKVDETTRADYRAAGMEDFRPSKKQVLSSFFEVPIDVLESIPQIEEWAQRAIRAAKEKTIPLKRKSIPIPTSYLVTARVWAYKGPGGWHFLTIPKKESTEIKKNAGFAQKAWGSLAVAAKIGHSEWETSLFYDGKRSAYLLPVKADIRKKESITTNAKVTVHVRVRI